jgi:DNA mismatch repair protein MutL
MDEHVIVMEHRESLGDMGIAVEDFSDNSIVIRTVPEVARAIRVEDMVRDFIGAVKEDRSHEPVAGVIAASVACHSAKRAGDDFHSAELVDLIEQALEEGREMRCPHGRPYIYSLDKKDLEKLFKRQ